MKLILVLLRSITLGERHDIDNDISETGQGTR
jgi:hypothetical protein